LAEKGWIAVQRKIQSSFVWANPFVLKLWLLCLFKASHNGNRFLFNGVEVWVDRGQFVTGRAALAFEYNEGMRREHQLSPTSTNRWLRKFRDLGMVDIKTTTKYSVVTVINYDLYQSGGQLPDSKWTTSEQQVDTINNAKNANKSATAAVSAENPFTFYQENGFGMLNGINAEQIQGWVDDFKNAGSPEPTAMVIKAMQTAVDRNKVSWGYARGILSNWDRRNIRSLAAVEADQKSYEAKQVSNGRSKQPPKPRENFDREYTEEDGKW
jgi:DnaD/phage-associated family protein